jgi:hypothetical protein
MAPRDPDGIASPTAWPLITKSILATFVSKAGNTATV